MTAQRTFGFGEACGEVGSPSSFGSQATGEDARCAFHLPLKGPLFYMDYASCGLAVCTSLRLEDPLWRL